MEEAFRRRVEAAFRRRVEEACRCRAAEACRCRAAEASRHRAAEASRHRAEAASRRRVEEACHQKKHRQVAAGASHHLEVQVEVVVEPPIDTASQPSLLVKSAREIANACVSKP